MYNVNGKQICTQEENMYVANKFIWMNTIIRYGLFTFLVHIFFSDFSFLFCSIWRFGGAATVLYDEQEEIIIRKKKTNPHQKV